RAGRGQNPGLHLGRLVGGEHPGELSDQAALGEVDDAHVQGPGRAGEPAGEVEGQLQVGVGRSPGQGQRRGDLVGDELAQLGREGPEGGGFGPLGQPAASQLGDGGPTPRAAPRLQPAPGAEHPDQFVIGEAGQGTVTGSRVGQLGQRPVRRTGVESTTSLETRARARGRVNGYWSLGRNGYLAPRLIGGPGARPGALRENLAIFNRVSRHHSPPIVAACDCYTNILSNTKIKTKELSS